MSNRDEKKGFLSKYSLSFSKKNYPSSEFNPEIHTSTSDANLNSTFHGTSSNTTQRTKANEIFEDDFIPRKSVLIDDSMDPEAFARLIDQGRSMVFQFIDDDDDPSRLEYNSEISVFPRFLEDAIAVCQARAREWSHSVKKLVEFLENKHKIESEVVKTISRSTLQTLDTLRKEGFKGDGTYYRSVIDVLKKQEHANVLTVDYLDKILNKVLKPLKIELNEHDNSRRSLWNNYNESKKKLGAAVDKHDAAKGRYQKAAQAWEKSVEEMMREQQSNYRVKLEKRAAREEEAKETSLKEEGQYKEQIRAANKALEDFNKYGQLILSAFERLIRNSDEKMKAILVQHLTIEEEYYRPFPTFISDLRNIMSKVDDLSDLQQFIVKTSNGKITKTAPYTFERHKFNSEVESMMGATPAEAVKGLHNFKTVAQAFKCRECQNISFGGLECVDCGFHCHKKCVEKLKNDCPGPTNNVAPEVKALCVFGIPLDQQPKVDGIPYIVLRVTKEVENRGMEEEGLYRLSGIKSACEDVGSLFEERGFSDKEVDLSKEPDIHAITGCLKNFFRKLPEPLVPYPLYQPLIMLAKQPIVNLIALSGILSDFPEDNYLTLNFMMAHLNKLTQYSEHNKMRASNLAIIFGPSLLRSMNSEVDPMAALAENSQQCKVVELLISKYQEIFDGSNQIRESREKNLASKIESRLDLDEPEVKPEEPAEPVKEETEEERKERIQREELEDQERERERIKEREKKMEQKEREKKEKEQKEKEEKEQQDIEQVEKEKLEREQKDQKEKEEKEKELKEKELKEKELKEKEEEEKESKEKEEKEKELKEKEEKELKEKELKEKAEIEQKERDQKEKQLREQEATKRTKAALDEDDDDDDEDDDSNDLLTSIMTAAQENIKKKEAETTNELLKELRPENEPKKVEVQLKSKEHSEWLTSREKRGKNRTSESSEEKVSLSKSSTFESSGGEEKVSLSKSSTFESNEFLNKSVDSGNDD